MGVTLSTGGSHNSSTIILLITFKCHNTKQHNTLQYNTMQYNTIQEIQYTTINIIQYNAGIFRCCWLVNDI